jgi:signal transduction histidine kinase
MTRPIRASSDTFVTWIALVGGVLGTSIEVALLATTQSPNSHATNVVWGLLFTAVPAALLIVRRPSAITVVVAAFVTILLAATVTDSFGNGRARIWLVGLLFTAGTVIPLLNGNKRRIAAAFSSITPVLIWVTRTPDESPIDTVGIAVVFTLIYTAATYQILAVLRDVRRTEVRKKSVYLFAPIATWEQDYTRVVKHFLQLRTEGVVDLREHLDANPEHVPYLLSLCRQGTISKATFDVFEIDIRAEFVGPQALETVGPGIPSAIADQMVALFNGETTAKSEVTARTFRGRRIDLQLHWAAPIFDGQPDYGSVLLSAVDRTAQKDAERRLAAEVKAKDQFVASISHELRTPLTAVVGIAEELADNRGTIGPEEAQDLISVMASEGRDVANIVEDLLVSARLDSGQVTIARERIDLAATVLRATTHFPCTVAIDSDVSVKADPHRVRQIVRNLLSNADRYGGHNVRAVGGVDGDNGFLEIRDNGEGTPEDMRAVVFDPYRRADPDRGLTAAVGLGLTISRSLAELMDGNLTYDHVDGDSIFRLTLPLC